MRVFFFNDTATTEIYTLSLHDALPILQSPLRSREVDQNLHIGPAIPLAREIRGFQAGSGRSIRRGPVWCVARIRLSRNAKSQASQARSSRRLWPAAARMTLVASPRVPSRKFRPR